MVFCFVIKNKVEFSFIKKIVFPFGIYRDTNELQPIKNANQAVIRFFRLIQAARDGQDQKDCLATYPNCNLNTE